MATARQRPILWNVYEEHLDEAAFLWERWEAALVAANYTLAEVAAGPEERLRAHLDALVVGGRAVAEKLLLPALEGDDLERVRPSALALLQAEDADHFDAVLEVLAGAEPAKRAAVVRAVGLSQHPKVVPWLAALWTHAAPWLRAVILEVIAGRDLSWVASKLPEALRSNDARLLAVALGLIRRLPDRDPAFAWDLEQCLAHEEPQVRDEAIATGFVLGSKKVLSTCRRAVAMPATGNLPFALLASSPDEADRAILRGCLKDPMTARHGLWALGFAGDVESADVLLARLADKKLGKLAAEAFSAITGLRVVGPFRAVGVPVGPEADEVGPGDPPPEVRPEDALPLPVPAAVAEWWRKNRGRFRSGQRYVAGVPRTAEALRAAMVEVPMWRREVLALEIAAGTHRGATVDMTGWTDVGAGGDRAPSTVTTLSPREA